MIHPHMIPIKLDEKEVELITDTLQARVEAIADQVTMFPWVTNQDDGIAYEGPKTVTVTLGDITCK